MSKRFKAPVALALSVALCGALALGMPAPALAITSAQLQEQLDAARSTLDQLNEQAEQVSEQLNGTKVQLAQTNAKIDETNQSIAQTEQDIEAKKAELAQRQATLAQKVSSDYKTGGVDFLSIILNANSFDDFVSRVHYADKVSEKQADQISSTKQLRDELNDKNIELTAQKQQLEQQQAQQAQLASQQEAQQQELTAKVGEAQSYVDGLDQEVKDKLAEEQEAERKAQEEAAAQARAEAQAQAQQSASSSNGSSSSSSSNGGSGSHGGSSSAGGSSSSSSNGSNGGSSNGGSGSSSGSGSSNSGSSSGSGSGSSSSGSSATQSQRDAVVAAAYSMLGGNYVYGAYDPANRTFDCSGFTMYCFAQAGISLPHQSEMQRGYISNFKPLSQLVPGDLVWKSGHVGIYVGGGQMIHASTPSKGIIIGPMTWGMVGGGWPA